MRPDARRIAFIWFMIACLVFLAGCSSSNTLEKIEPQEGVETIVLEGTCSAEVGDDTIKVTLHSNLLEGTVVVFSIDTYDGTELASQIYSVSGETIYAEFERDDTYTGIVYASVVASPSIGSQPENVRDAYGRYFQNVDGEHIIWDTKENIFIVQSEKINLG